MAWFSGAVTAPMISPMSLPMVSPMGPLSRLLITRRPGTSLTDGSDMVSFINSVMWLLSSNDATRLSLISSVLVSSSLASTRADSFSLSSASSASRYSAIPSTVNPRSERCLILTPL